MSFKELKISQEYSTDNNDDILFDFYIPVLSKAKKYDRLAGFFSSSSLAVCAKGIVHFILNGGNMRLVACPKLSKEDVETIQKATYNPEEYISEALVKEISEIEDTFENDHVKALGWMLANKKLEIKIACVYDYKGNFLDAEQIEDRGIFHQKVGILYDEHDNIISFSGSVNETASAWQDNIEEFKVFKSWHPAEKEYLDRDLKKFKRIWGGYAERIRTYEVPEAVEKELVKKAPSDIYNINWQKHYSREKIRLFNHQLEAIDFWVENNMKALFEMATATGKTFTALGCLDKIIKTYSKWVCVISAPQSHLSKQWENEINNFGIKYEKLIMADSTNPNWRHDLKNCLLDVYLRYYKNLIVLTTHSTLSKPDFVQIVEENKNEIPMFLIADEVHGLGASKRRVGLTESYDMRLGLSATPKRFFDDVGTAKIYNYFNNKSYEFGLDRATTEINPMTGKTYLTPYKYIPIIVYLEDFELEDYIDKTKAIVRKLRSSKNNEEDDEVLRKLYFKRADVIKNAVNKYKALNEIILELSDELTSTLLFCSPQQIGEVMKMLSKKGIVVHRFTNKQGKHPEKRFNGLSEREYLIKKFSEEAYQILVSIKCLDEGVDIPSAKNAILMSSSTNPREYIQRIGRVIRRATGKAEARIYDMIAVTNFKQLPPELRNIEKNILNKELERAEEIAVNAKNNAEAVEVLYNLKKDYY